MELKTIASFSVNHDYIVPGLYVSQVQGDITTYDMRTRIPNDGTFMDNSTMHTFEHLFAVYARNSCMGNQIIYFGPMGCQTGFYLLVRDADNDKVLMLIKETLQKVIRHEGAVFGSSRQECGNYKSLKLECARSEAERYLKCLNDCNVDFKYHEE